MPLPFQPKPLDADAADFIRRSGATDRAAINAFVRGVKALGLWNNMVCWPLRSAQNAGFGSTAYSMGGLGRFDGTLVNAPGWTADGLTFNNAGNQYVSTPFSYDPSTLSTGFATIVRPTDAYPTGNNQSREIIGNRGLTGGATALGKQPSGSQVVSLFDSVAGHNAASGNSQIFVTYSNQWHFAGAFLDPFTREFFNQADANTATATSTGGSIISGANDLWIGRSGPYMGAERSWTGSIAAAAVVRQTTITSAQINSLRVLMRNTLGTGLGLP